MSLLAVHKVEKVHTHSDTPEIATCSPGLVLLSNMKTFKATINLKAKVILYKELIHIKFKHVCKNCFVT